MSDDVDSLTRLGAELCALGCCVFTAQDLEEVADLVRTGILKRFVLVHIDTETSTAEELRAAMQERLPGWTVQADETQDLLARHRAAAAVQLPN
jgi:hypothetical protein